MAMGWSRFGKKKDMPGGLWIKCEACATMIFRKDFTAERICPECGHHFAVSADERVQLLCDEGSFQELWAEMKTVDSLGFSDRVSYTEKIENTRQKTGKNEAMVCGRARVLGQDIALGIMDFGFLGGSMGVVVGEKVTRLVEYAAEETLPLVIFCSSGGARMHEGALSLMQMAKTCGALQRFQDHGGFYIAVLTNPTTGGVTASFASVADVILAEPGALIGFAGPRVIKETLKQDLPKGFQRAEFLLEKGQVDRIVRRADLRVEIAKLCAYATGSVNPATVGVAAEAEGGEGA
ncbi:MAG: acetyl-CoA carboxylase carboxyltransferase subunit beta [Planctomycetes bacterium]|nr:acetyl-CoA carboxylase carboxyltransferase subunit beta [Planctomycetota bacterium]MCB9890348.1 acetyl-CoA carboxylase carboxyltransferase subunit beta [Planctomycetota bacterium]MCB9918166.1 acetyl-CoA carboxylase carboxyltransferase subunit beta [Planctomycetota bacterium]